MHLNDANIVSELSPSTSPGCLASSPTRLSEGYGQRQAFLVASHWSPMEETIAQRTNPHPTLQFTQFANDKKQTYTGRNGRDDLSQYIPLCDLAEYWTHPKIKSVLKSYKPHIVIDVTSIKTNFIRVFSTLVYVDRVQYLHVFTQHGLNDNRFPREARPSQLNGAIFDDLFSAFLNSQWIFFPLVLDSSQLLDLRIPSDVVLPFSAVKKIKEGDVAHIYMVHVRQPCKHPDEFHCNPLPTTLVLKKFKDQRYHKMYQNECSALTALKELKNEHIVKYYGSFTQNGTFNILLEPVDGGNLYEYLTNTPRPTSPADIRRFWQSVFSVLQGVHGVHQLSSTDEEFGHYRGVHEDIKPDNILLQKGPSGSAYDFIAILADFGFSHIRLVPPNGADQLGIDRHGNQTYGAPEASHHHRYLRNGPNRISSKADIWSSGCVLSDAASWVAFGPRGPMEYHNQRVEAATNFENKGHQGCFHNGLDRLPTVNEMHQSIRGTCHPSDTITTRVIDLIETRMLRRNPSDRMSARELHEEFLQILTEKPKPPLTITTSSFQEMISQLARQNIQSSGVHPHTHRRLLSEESMVYSSGDSSDAGGSQSSPEPTRDSSSAPTTPLRRPGPHAIALGSDKNTVHSSTEDTYNSGLSPVSAASHSLLVMSEDSFFRSRECNASVPSVPGLREARLTTRDAHAWRRAKKAGLRPDDGVDLNVRRLRNALGNRDHFFFIDDSPTMEQFRSEVEEMFYTLGYISKAMDKNGIELGFASTIKEGNIETNAHVGPLLSVLKGCKYDQDGGFMEDSLGYLVDDVIISRLPEKTQARRLSFSNSYKKPISVFIFTDGRWGTDETAACGVDKPIRKLMNQIRSRDLNRTLVMIQFLQFGNDEWGKKHLTYLDDFGKSEKLDVVDTRSTNGDVCSMFIGSISQKHDEQKHENH